jgi:hypothetical protein
MRFQIILVSLCAVAVSGRRGTPVDPKSSPAPSVRPFWCRYPYGFGLDMPDAAMDEKEVKKMKEVKRGEIDNYDVVVRDCSVLSGWLWAALWFSSWHFTEMTPSCQKILLTETNDALYRQANTHSYTSLSLRTQVSQPKKARKEQEMNKKKPGWFRSSPEHHTKFKDIEDTMGKTLD